MYFEYVIFFLSALLVQVKAGQIAGSSYSDTSGMVPQLLENQSSNNATFVEAITSCGNNNLSKEYSYITEAAFAPCEEELICSSAAVERYRRASNSNAIASDGSKCTTNLLRARLALAAANARANAADDKPEVIVAAKTVPVPTQLIPPKLLHKQIIGMSLSPCPINVPAPSCSCTSFKPSISVNTNSVNPIGNNINCRYTDSPRPLPLKPIASAGMCAVPIRVPDADVRQTPTTTAADVVAARLAEHRLLTQQANSGQCPCSTNLPAPSCDCSYDGSSNFISSNFLVTSIGSESPPGIAIDTDVTLLGNLNVCGTMPFMSAVQFDGLYDTIGSGSVSFGCGTSEPVIQPPLSNAVTSTATIDSCRRPDVDVPKAPTKLAAIGAGASQARIVDADDGQSSTTTSPAAALSARLAQQRLLTGQQSITGQCPQPRSLPTPICGCSLGGPYSSAMANSMPITQNLGNPSTNNNAALTPASITSYRCPSFPGTLPAVKALSAEPDAIQSRVPNVDQQASATSMAAAVSARLAQHRLLTEQQSNNEQCPRCNSSPISKCSCSASGSSSSVIIPSSGGSLHITSIGSESSPGVAVDTDVALSGQLDVCGTLPFTSAVQFQGLYDTTGSGLVSFGCGDSEPVTQKRDNPKANKSALGTSGTTTINSCGQPPKYTDTPRALSTLVATSTDVGKLQTKMADVDETRATNMAAVVSSRLAQQRLLKGFTAPKCDCGSTVSSNFVTNPSSGAGLPVTSISPEVPSIDVDADIGLFGNLNVSGELPFQSAVEFQGLYKTSGSGTVSFGCGDSVAITQKLDNPMDNYTIKSTCQ